MVDCGSGQANIPWLETITIQVIQRGKPSKSGSRSQKKIPLLSVTISKSERKKGSYLEQYKKKCSRKLKKVMKVTEMKADTNTSPASDQCSISSKPSELSIRSNLSDNKDKIEINSNTNNVEEEQQFYYDSIKKYELNRITIIVNQVEGGGLIDSPLQGNSIQKQKSSTNGSNHPSLSSHAGFNLGRVKGIVQKIEPNKRSTDSKQNVELLYIKEEQNAKQAPNNDTISAIPQQQGSKRSSPRSVTIQRPKVTLKSSATKLTTVVSGHNIQPDTKCSKTPFGKSPFQTYSSCFTKSNQSQRSINARQISAQRLSKIAGKYITEKKGKRGDRAKDLSGDSKTQSQTETQEAKVEQSAAQTISNATTEKSLEGDHEPSGLHLTKNVQSEVALSVFSIHGQNVNGQQRPNTTNNYNRYFVPTVRGKTAPRKNYLQIHQAKKNIRSIPLPVAKPVPIAKPVPVPKPAKPSKTEEIKQSRVNIERNVKTPNPKENLIKVESSKPGSRQLKRYYLKKKPTDTSLVANDQEEAEEDLQLKLLEDKKEQLQKQLQRMKSKTRCTYVV